MGEVLAHRARQSDKVHKYLLTKETGIYKFTYRLKNIRRCSLQKLALTRGGYMLKTVKMIKKEGTPKPCLQNQRAHGASD
jgi:hypothetical protein